MKSLRRFGRRGFTLVELMIVVAIVGVLAVIALVGYNKYMRSAAAGEARAMLLSIRGAQDNYKTEVLTYKSCGNLSNGADYYPRALGALNGKKAAWEGWVAAAQYTCWRELNVKAAGPVRYSFATQAGPPGLMTAGIPPNVPPASWQFGTYTSNDPWFVAAAAGDYNGDGIYSILYTSSGQSEVTVVDDTQ